jgi:hypothetical protein
MNPGRGGDAEHMEMMRDVADFNRMKRRLEKAQKALARTENVVKHLQQQLEAPVFDESTHTPLECQVLCDLFKNLQRRQPTYEPATYIWSFMLKCKSAAAHEFVRRMFPLPGGNYVDAKFCDRVKGARNLLKSVEEIPGALEEYKARYIPNGYDRFVGVDGRLCIPVIISVDAMAIEPYRTVTGEEIMRYLFVYYCQPIDHDLPSRTLAVHACQTGNCKPETKAMLFRLAQLCWEHDFCVVACSADGDVGYSVFMDPWRNDVYWDIIFPNSLTEVVNGMPVKGLHITDFLHFLKCERGRLARYFLAFSQNSLDMGTAVPIECLKGALGLDYPLTKKKGDAQLKDSLALKVFTLRNACILLRYHYIDAGLLVLPMSLWREALNAENITMGARFLLLAVGYDIVWHCWEWWFGQRTQGVPIFPELNQDGPSFPWRECDMYKYMCSVATLGKVMSLGIPNTSLARVGTSNLEKLFGYMRSKAGFDSHVGRLMDCLAKTQVCMELSQDHQVFWGKKRVRNNGGVVHTGDEGKIKLEEAPADVGASFIAVLTTPGWTAEKEYFIHRMSTWLEGVAATIHDRPDPNVSVLGGIFALHRIQMAQVK